MLIIVTIFIMFIYFYWTSIINMFKIFYNSNVNLNKTYSFGNPWFIGIVIINVVLCGFLLYYYYSRKGKGSMGDRGPQGQRGLPGTPGTPCVVGCN
jgi:hypothetical protein